MTKNQVIYLCNAYQQGLEAERKLKDVIEILGGKDDATLIDSITTNIFEAFMEVIKYEYEEEAYNCLLDNLPSLLYDLQEDEFKN